MSYIPFSHENNKGKLSMSKKMESNYEPNGETSGEDSPD